MRMMRKLLFCFLIVFMTIYASSSGWTLPDWILPEVRRYPTETFLFNVGHSNGTGEEAFKRATADAHRKVAATILKEVTYVIRFNKAQLEHDMVREHYGAVLENYFPVRQESPALQLEGLSVRNLTVDLARPDQDTYALVYIKRDKLKDIYANHASRLRGEIKRRLETAKAFEKALDIESAVKTYLRTYPLYESLKEAEVVQIGAEYALSFNSAFERLVKATTDTVGDSVPPHRSVIKRVEELEEKIIINFDDIFDVIDSQFLRQTDPISGSVSVYPLIYEDSEMSCPFAQEFSIVLHEKFGWITVDPAQDFKQTSPNISKVNPDFPSRRFSPSCWENGDEITIRATLRDVNTGKFLASAVVRFLNSQLRPPLICKPNNWTQAVIDKDIFAPQYYPVPDPQRSTKVYTSAELVEHQFSPSGDGELKAEVWTDKGRDAISYTKGETMAVFGRVNQPAYLRVLYILAGDRRYTLLQDNYYIDSSNVNSKVKIGEFVCTPPFGAEILVVAARTEPFPSIETYEENGYVFLSDQDAESAARSFRGMQRISDELNGQQRLNPNPNETEQLPDFQQSEAQLVLTTKEK